MLRFQLQVLLHHWRVGVKILDCAHGVMISISLKILRFERLNGRLFLLLSHEKKCGAEKVTTLRGIFHH